MTLLNALLAINWLEQKHQGKLLREAVTMRVQPTCIITREITHEIIPESFKEESTPCTADLVNRAAAEDVLKDCGHSNSLDFGSKDILYS
jgi:hypothetical protein